MSQSLYKDDTSLVVKKWWLHCVFSDGNSFKQSIFCFAQEGFNTIYKYLYMYTITYPLPDQIIWEYTQTDKYD